MTSTLCQRHVDDTTALLKQTFLDIATDNAGSGRVGGARNVHFVRDEWNNLHGCQGADLKVRQP